MAVALGAAKIITLGFLLLVSNSSNLRIEGEVGNATPHLRELLLEPNVHGHGVSMEAQGRRTIGETTRGCDGGPESSHNDGGGYYVDHHPWSPCRRDGGTWPQTHWRGNGRRAASI
ncbi:hypothetical protein JG688_00016148 [Phytophthora aleatoria]|uniref:RxLR effector protein n=1 Tax=Phytophthora aleatoria TaxID=2496075 RepID=A0A8J5LWE0_9STRA|nr:hypothetical protein JG688_00016148 [Phytophthora aleatoria]